MRLKPHLSLPLRLGAGVTPGLLYYDSTAETIRLATGSEIESTIYSDTYWEDLNVPLTTTKVGALNKPDFDYTNIGFLFPQNDASEIIYFIVQMPHRWKQGTAIYPHIHWQQSADQTPVFKLDYKIYNNNELVPADFSTYTMSTKAFTYSSGNLGQISKNTTGITMTGKTISCMILCKLYRDDNAYTGDVLVNQFDIHYEIDSAGSDDEYDK